MKKILSIQEAIRVAKKLKKQKKSIVLAGGFFDILHLGHINFLQNSKRQGDCLFVLLEDDKKAKERKGSGRPINPQKIRALMLSVLQDVDYVVLLKNMTNNNQYDKIITQMSPGIITATKDDPHIEHKIRQAKLVGGKVKYVNEKIKNHSTTMLVKKMNSQQSKNI